jgi:molybdate transport system substrate-binding protein
MKAMILELLRPQARTPRRRLAVLLLAMGSWWLATACSPPSHDAGPRTLVVLAAASLTEAFAAIEAELEAAEPGVDVVVSTGGSQALRVQIEHGAPADVFAAANAEHIDALVSAGLVRQSSPFAEGVLVLAVPPANPAGIRSLEDLPSAARIVLGAPEVPVGQYTRTMLDRAEARYGAGFRARVEAHVVSLEPNVRQVLAKVELGEADAAVVYRSDVVASRNVKVIEIPAELDVRAQYHVGVLTAAAQPELAQRFVDHLRSAAGRAVLERHGFRVTDG